MVLSPFASRKFLECFLRPPAATIDCGTPQLPSTAPVIAADQWIMDPFSAATGVAGLISLGIEVCKGLNAYCQDYRSKDSEILAIGQHANKLRAFLYLIESRMKGNSQVDQSLATTFEDCHATCTLCLQDFAALNTKYSRPKAVSGFRKQGKAFVR